MRILFLTLLIFTFSKFAFSQIEEGNFDIKNNKVTPANKDSVIQPMRFGESWSKLSEDTVTIKEYGFVPSKEKLEQLIISKFEAIDPLEYYLSDKPKFCDKQKMIEVESELRLLIKIYRTNYYDINHINQKQNNAYILNSLIGTKFAYDGLKNQDNKNVHNATVVQLKEKANNDITMSYDGSNSLLNQAIILIKENNLDEAERIIDKIILELENSKNKTSYLEYYNKAFIKFEQKNYEAAKLFAKKTNKVRNDFYLGNLLLGDAYLKTDSATNALYHYKNGLSNKINIVTQERCAYANILLGNYKEASVHYQNIIDTYKRTDGIIYRELNALSLAHQNKFTESLAIVSFLKVVKKNSPMPHFIEGWNYLLMSDYNKAIDCFNEAENKGDKLYSGIGKAFSYYYLKNYYQSSSYFFSLENTDGYEKFRNNKAVLQMAAFAFTNTRNYDYAEEKFNCYSKLYKKENGYFIGMSMCSFGNYQFTTAIQYLDSVKNPPKNSPDFTYLQGIYNLKNENYNKAVSYFETALKLDSNHVKSYDGLGASLDALGKYSEAISAFDKGIKLDNKNPYLIFNKGTAICNIGKMLFSEDKIQLALDTVKAGCILLDNALSIDRRIRVNLNKGNAFMCVKDSLTAMYYYDLENSLSSKINIGVLQYNFGDHTKGTKTWKEVLKTDSTEKLAKYNLEAIKNNSSSNLKSKLGFGNKNLRYYENFYYELVYYYDIEKPFIYEDYFEPLVPLGYSNLKFEKLSE